MRKFKISNRLTALRNRWMESLGFRLSVFIMSVTLLLFSATIIVCLFQMKNMTTYHFINDAEYDMKYSLDYINQNLTSVEQSVKDYAANADFYTSTKEGCFKLCSTIVSTNPNIYAATMMFRPDYFPDATPQHHLFAPSVSRLVNSKELMCENLVDTSDDVFYYIKNDSNWVNTVKHDHSYWCEPYYDIYSTKQLLVTYSYPLHDKDGKIYAILCADVQLSWLSDHMNSYLPSDSSNVMIMTRNGHFLLHHIPQFMKSADGAMLTSNIMDKKVCVMDTALTDMFTKMLAGKKGIKNFSRPVTCTMEGVTDIIPEGFAMYAPIDATGWSAAIVCPQSDVVMQASKLVNRVMLTSFIGLIVMALALWFMVREMVAPYKKFAAVNADINTAARIQMSMIPEHFPTSSVLSGAKLYASMAPAKLIGGDLYDYAINDQTLTFIVGDVAGKGIPAALFMSSTLTLFRAFAKTGCSPGEIVMHINQTLAKGNDTMMFVTVFVASIDMSTGRMIFCNGGHNAPVVIHDKKAEFLHVQPNLPLGIDDVAYFEEEQATFGTGDKLVIYTDGVTEAEDIQGNLYGDSHLLDFLSNGNFLSAEDLCNCLAEDVRAHAGDAEQSDDITMMCISFKES